MNLNEWEINARWHYFGKGVPVEVTGWGGVYTV